MTDTETEASQKDAAWITIDTPFDARWLEGFIDDVERVFRINSLISYAIFEKTGADTYRLAGKNNATGKVFDVTANARRTENGVEVRFGSGLKTATRLEIKGEGADGAQLVITDDYSGTPENERKQRLDEVDSSLVRWGHDIHRYLRQWKRWSGVPGWQWYMRRIWQPMKPMARRITFLLIIITVLEFVVFLFVFVIFRLELNQLL